MAIRFLALGRLIAILFRIVPCIFETEGVRLLYCRWLFSASYFVCANVFFPLDYIRESYLLLRDRGSTRLWRKDKEIKSKKTLLRKKKCASLGRKREMEKQRRLKSWMMETEVFEKKERCTAKRNKRARRGRIQYEWIDGNMNNESRKKWK